MKARLLRQFGIRERFDARKNGWRLALCVLLTLILYRQTLQNLMDVWRSSATFAHGMLVPPLVIWLLWRQRHVWRALPYQPLAIMLLPLLLCGALWLTGTIVHAPVLQEFALVGMLIMLALLWQGYSRTRSQLFPLLFLLLAVPFGEFLIPQLVRFTSHFIVLALRLTGIPVLHEHNLLTLPSGVWSVQEACSGLRYLIAMLAIASLYAHIAMRGMGRRISFILIALLLPLVGNGLRAVAIILLGHYTDMRLAAGADHLLYGGAFFAVLLAILFAIGMRWSAPIKVAPAPDPIPASAPVHLSDTPSRSTLVCAVLLSLACWPALAALLQLQLAAQRSITSIDLPPAPPSWQSSDPAQAAASGAIAAVKLTAEAEYTRGAAHVRLLLRTDTTDETATTSRDAATHEGDGWQVLDSRQRVLYLPAGRLTLQEIMLQKGRASQIVWQWQRLNGSDYAHAWQARLSQLYAVLRQHPVTPYQIRLSSIAPEGGEPAEAAMRALLEVLYAPLIERIDHAAR